MWSISWETTPRKIKFDPNPCMFNYLINPFPKILQFSLKIVAYTGRDILTCTTGSVLITPYGYIYRPGEYCLLILFLPKLVRAVTICHAGGFRPKLIREHDITSTLGTWRPIVFNVLRCMNND